ncbi:MAG: DNA polymerase III subunit delta' [Candidatus Omnitrophica bacterium]|nr:DNA polymerase III subunit delta' [Candidatus Omnitrophota bacterium]MBU1871582.1 DNA polymerase III subunit delta' [Candidatus Omnitrophota bacterium]
MAYNKKSASNNLSRSEELAEELIKNAWENNRLASAYLFFGPAGTGRMTLARSLTKTVNCQEGTFPPCLSCASCRKIDNNNHPDVHYVQKEDSNFIKIEQIQQMQREIYLRPFEGGKKVFIILSAENLTEEASNSLLKILEEPPGNSLIILIASDLRRMLATIISRCQKVRFLPLDRFNAELALKRNYHLDEKLSHYLAFSFEGRLGEALKFKEGDIIKEKNRIIRQFISNPELLSENNDLKDKEKLALTLKILIGCIRDIYLLKSGSDKQGLINEDIGNEISLLAKRFSFKELELMLEKLCDWFQNISQNINPRLLADNIGLLWKK